MRPTETTIHDQADLERTWRALMRPLGFSRHSIWLMLIGPDGHPLPQLTEIEDAAEPPDEEQVEALAELLGRLHDELLPGGSFAFLRTRPGRAGLDDDDRGWARGLYAAGRLAGVPVEVVHRACDQDLVPVPMDEVLAEPA